MSDTAENGSAATPGEWLKQAREQAGLPVEQVANDLYLDIQVVQIMESNRFKELGAPVYAKGYLRKYARLLGLSEEEVLRRYHALSDAPVVADPIPVAMGSVPESRRPLPRWALWLVIGLIVLAVLVTLWNLHTPVTETAQRDVVISQPLDQPARQAVLLPPPAGSAPAESAAGAAPAAAGMASLRLQFKGDSWVEVYDANNRQVLYEMGTTNSIREINAVPPLRILLGAARAVGVQVNAREVAVPAADVETGVAQFVVNASGVIE